MNYIIDKKGLIQPENDFFYKNIVHERKLNHEKEKYENLKSEVQSLKELLYTFLERGDNG